MLNDKMEQLDNTLTKLEKFLKDEKVCSETDLRQLEIAADISKKIKQSPKKN